MKIVYLLAGAGGMYCGTCLQGNTLVAALRKRGEEALLAPLYLPLRTDEPNTSLPQIFFGGLNVFLQEHSALFRHTPPFLDRLLDHPALLRRISRRGKLVRPGPLGAMTVSMLQGENGRQRKELAKLIEWLQKEARPDVVHLNNALLLGLAGAIQRQLDVPVVCSLAGEDVFIEKLPEPHYSAVRRLLRERAGDAAALVAMNRYYADFMTEYLSLPRRWIDVVPPGISLEGYDPGPADEGRPPDPPIRIGFLARICQEKGLHLLADALSVLARDTALPPVRVLAAGYLDPADRWYFEGICRQLQKNGIADRFEYRGELDRPGKIAFLQSLDVFCLPAAARESKGLPVLEAWANGVPAVLPDAGAFPELVQDTGGGILYDSQKPEALSAALKRMICDREFARRCGRQARQAVRGHYGAETMAHGMSEIYRRVTDRAKNVSQQSPLPPGES